MEPERKLTRRGPAIVSIRMQQRLAACALSLLLALPAWAHPGVGIVRDRQGSVFYTDLVHVWRIAPDGRKSIAVRDVHTHELALDSLGNLYGEDNRYQGGDRWRHRIWQRDTSGRVTDIVPWREGFWRDYGFVHDGAGATYWVNCPERRCSIRRRAANGRVTTVAPGVRFDHQINWIAADSGGALFFVQGPDLHRIDAAGRLTTVARELGTHPMGITPLAGGDVLVAVYGAAVVVRVTPTGRRTIAARSPPPWAPSGVVAEADGTLWILEYSTANEARVRRVATDGRTTVY